MIPYKRYETEVVEAALNQDIQHIPCYEETIRAFQNWFQDTSKKLSILMENKQFQIKYLSVLSSLHLNVGDFCGAKGWLSLWIAQLVKVRFWEETTRLLC